MTDAGKDAAVVEVDGVRYLNGHLDLNHAPSLATYIGKSLASHVSGNRMPCMSGDDRERIPEHIRRRYDGTCESVAANILKWQAASGNDKPAGYAGVKDAEVNNSLPTQGGGAGDRETVARIIAGPMCDATKAEHVIMREGRYAFCTQCGETVTKATISLRDARNKAEAILSALQAAPSEGDKGGWLELRDEAFGLSCEDQHTLATQIAANIGYDLTPDSTTDYVLPAAPSEGGEPVGWQRRMRNTSTPPGDYRSEWSKWSDCSEEQHDFAKANGYVQGFSELKVEARPVYARPPAPSEEPLVGWRLAPLKPTDEMVNAARVAGYRHDLHAVWDAMLSAAPAPDAIRGGE